MDKCLRNYLDFSTFTPQKKKKEIFFLCVTSSCTFSIRELPELDVIRYPQPPTGLLRVRCWLGTMCYIFKSLFLQLSFCKKKSFPFFATHVVAQWQIDSKFYSSSSIHILIFVFHPDLSNFLQILLYVTKGVGMWMWRWRERNGSSGRFFFFL